MKKFLSTLIAFVMIFVAAVPAYAVDESDSGARETHFFTEHEHTDLNFSDLTYEHADPAPLLKEFAELKALCADAANRDAFYERFLKAVDEYDKMSAMLTLLSIRKNADVTDEWAFTEYDSLLDDLMTVNDALCQLIRDALNSPCGEVLSSKMPDDVRDSYLAYEDLTEERRAMTMEETALENEYYAAMDDDSLWTYTYDGREWSADDAITGFYTGQLDLDTANEIYMGALYKSDKAMEAIGGIYLRMIELRNRIARDAGYDNYAEYAYAVTYNRDYTLEEVEAFSAAVKQYLVPVVNGYSEYVVPVDIGALPEDVAYTGEEMFETLRPYFAQLSSELLESMLYTYEHGAYNIADDPHKLDAGYSLCLPYYEMPFYFNSPKGTYLDLQTTIHEMGHNNVAYWKSEKWNEPNVDIDTAEVHSQGLELLMTRFYPELFGSQAEAAAVEKSINIIDSILQGCLYDELQRYAYTTPDVTLEQINEKNAQLVLDYGVVDPDDEETLSLYRYFWIRIHHTFDQPMYYISYATSAAGAFAFWEEMQQDYFQAVDHYLEFSAQTNSYPFQKTFESVGMTSPLSAQYVQELAASLKKALFSQVGPFTDVSVDAWYAPYVYFCYTQALVNGTSETTFSPDSATTREQGMTILARFNAAVMDTDETYDLAGGVAWAVENEISDGADPHGALTREQLALMFYNLAVLYELEPEADGDLSQFPDAASVSAGARDAMSWAVGAGLVNGMDGSLNPQGTTTRAQFSTIMERFFDVLVASPAG